MQLRQPDRRRLLHRRRGCRVCERRTQRGHQGSRIEPLARSGADRRADIGCRRDTGLVRRRVGRAALPLTYRLGRLIEQSRRASSPAGDSTAVSTRRRCARVAAT